MIAPFAGVPRGVDAGYHLTWIQEFITLASQGIILPRWSAEAYHHFGSAAFSLYPPLTYYVAFGFHILTGSTNPVRLFQYTSLLGTVMSFCAARLLLRALGASSTESAAGAIIYTFAPYRIAELYSRSSLSSHLGYAFFPIVWLGLLAACSPSHRRRTAGALIFAVGSALVLVSNVALAIVTALTALIVAFVIPREYVRRAVVPAMVGALFALGLSAFYLSSVASYSSEIQLIHLLDVREYFWQDALHFRDLPGLFHLCLFYAAVIIIGYAMWRSKRDRILLSSSEKLLIGSGMTVVAVIAFLELPFLGSIVFAKVPLLQMIQGTWRLYIDTVLFLALAVGVVRSEMLHRSIVAVVALWVACSIPLLLLATLRVHVFAHSPSATSDPYTYAPRSAPANSLRLDSLLREHEADAMATFKPFDTSDRVKFEERTGNSETFEVQLQRRSPVTFHRFYWPAWHLYVENRELSTRPDSIGRAEAYLPAGEYRAVWRLEQSPLERAGAMISMLASAGIIAACSVGFYNYRRSKSRFEY